MSDNYGLIGIFIWISESEDFKKRSSIIIIVSEQSWSLAALTSGDLSILEKFCFQTVFPRNHKATVYPLCNKAWFTNCFIYKNYYFTQEYLLVSFVVEMGKREGR